EPSVPGRPVRPAGEEGSGDASGAGGGADAAAAAAARRSDRRAPARTAAVRGVRGLGRLRQGRGHQAPGGAHGPAARAGRAVRGAHARREAPPLPVALLAGPAGLGRIRGARPLLVRPGARRARRGVRHRGAVVAGVRGDHAVRAHPERRGDDPRQVLDARLGGGAAGPLREPRPRPAALLEAHGRGLAQPREAAGLRGRGRGHARAHRPPVGAVARGARRPEAAGAGDGRRDRVRGGGEGAALPRLRPGPLAREL
ncbi:MAG: Polyphosphate kinase 2, partial [uncultured Frankineae bacterium]